jgi:sugar lactone lactonase YvrE
MTDVDTGAARSEPEGARRGTALATRHPAVHVPFGRHAVDKLTDVVGTPLHKLSPIPGNAYNDGWMLRTVLGNLYFGVLVFAGFLGAWAVHDTGGLAIPPVLWLTLAIMGLGILDAFSGFVAWTVFTIGVVASGHFFSSHLVTGPPGTQGMLYAFTGLLSMAFVWFIGPQLPRRIRVLGFMAIRDRFQRRYIMLGDFFVITLLMVLILGAAGIFIPIFVGAYTQSLTQVTIEQHLTEIKIVVGIVAFFRVALDEFSVTRFESIPRSVGRARGAVATSLARAIGAFIALALIWELLGTIWQWPVTWILFMSLEYLSSIGERYLKPSSAYRFVPRNLFRIVVLLLFIQYAALVLAGRVVTGAEFLGWLVLLFAIVIAVFAILDGVEDEETGERPATWITRLLGIIVVIVLFVITQGIWSIPATPYSNPSAVTVGRTGNVYIADSGNNRVIEVPVTGERVRVGDGLSNPQGVAADYNSLSTVYISDTGNNRVLKVTLEPNQALGARHGSGRYAYFDAATTQSTVGSGFDHPTGIATTPSGLIFVVDTGNNRLVEIKPGNAQIVFASSLHGPIAVATDPFGHVYVTESDSGDVLRFTIGAGGEATKRVVFASGLEHPAGVAADAQGNVYVSNTGADNVREYLTTYQPGSASTANDYHNVRGDFNQPRGLGVDGQGHLYVANAGAGTVILSEPIYSGTTSNVGPSDVATAATMDPTSGTIYTVSESAGTLSRVTSTGSTVVATGLHRPTGVAWSTVNGLCVAEAGNGTIVKVNVNTGATTPFASGLTDIAAIAPDRSGGFFGVETALGELVQITSQGSVKGLVGGLAGPTGVAGDAYGSVVVTLSGSAPTKGEVWRLTFGAKAEVLVSALSAPSDAAADLQGNVYFIENGAERLWEDRGLDGAQIVWQGHSPETDPSAVVATNKGTVIIFPHQPGVSITVTLSTSDYEV